jgi:acetyl-CoA acetyltransferase
VYIRTSRTELGDHGRGGRWSRPRGACAAAPARPTDPDRLNPLGGAIAVGHPLGASGTVLMTRLVHHMRAHDIRFGLQTMCEGGGQANVTIVERL